MQKKTKIALGLGVAGLVGLGVAGAAMADGNWGMGRMWGMGHHGMMGMQMMERYDANKDGKLTQEEIDANRGQWLADFDADKNATLSLDEFKNLWLKARNEMMVREFQRFDRDGNGQVTLDEYKQPLAGIVANMDTNGHGALSKDDRPQGPGKRGDRMRHRMGGMDHGMDHGMGKDMGKDMGPGMMMEEDGGQQQ